MQQTRRIGVVEGCLGLLAFVGIFGWLLTVIHPLCPQLFPLPAASGVGEFGDSFGSVNALFSGLALLGVILSIRLQSKELALQREVNEATREELKRAADAQALTEVHLRNQTTINAISAMLSANVQMAMSASTNSKRAGSAAAGQALELEKELREHYEGWKASLTGAHERD